MLYQPMKIAATSRMCLQRSLAIVVVGFPAVPLMLGRTRLCISAAHTRKDIEWALEVSLLSTPSNSNLPASINLGQTDGSGCGHQNLLASNCTREISAAITRLLGSPSSNVLQILEEVSDKCLLRYRKPCHIPDPELDGVGLSGSVKAGVADISTGASRLVDV